MLSQNIESGMFSRCISIYRMIKKYFVNILILINHGTASSLIIGHAALFPAGVGNTVVDEVGRTNKFRATSSKSLLKLIIYLIQLFVNILLYHNIPSCILKFLIIIVILTPSHLLHSNDIDSSDLKLCHKKIMIMLIKIT